MMTTADSTIPRYNCRERQKGEKRCQIVIFIKKITKRLNFYLKLDYMRGKEGKKRQTSRDTTSDANFVSINAGLQRHVRDKDQSFFRNSRLL